MRRKICRARQSAQWVAAMVQVRKELEKTQVQLAAAIGMSKDAVASWECGRNQMRVSSALRISARLQRNILAGNTDPITAEELIQARVRDYERRLRRRLGI